MASRRRHGDGNEAEGVKARPAREPKRKPLDAAECEAPPRPTRRRRNAAATATPARREIRTLH